MKTKETLTIVRELKAPKELVFKAFSESAALAEWWGPKEMPITVVKLDFRPNGIFHYKMAAGDNVMWGLFVYGQINKPDQIEFTTSFSDETGKICRAPFAPNWPLEVFNQLSLTEKNGITTLTLSGYPVNATEEEEKMFFSFTANMQQGFEGTFSQLDVYLEKIQK